MNLLKLVSERYSKSRRRGRATHPQSEFPLLLRRAPAVSVSTVSLGAGAVMLVIAAKIYDHHAWASEVLVSLGSSVLLFAPLLVLTSFFGRGIARKDLARDEKIAEISGQVENVRRDVDDVRAEINDRTRERLSADRAEQETWIAAIEQAPRSTPIARVIRYGIELGFLSTMGPRVRVRNTEAYLRWTCATESDEDLALIVERRNGDRVDEFAWTWDQAVDEFGYLLGTTLDTHGGFPGDLAFDVGSVFADLHELVDFGYRSETGAGGVVDPRGPIIEFTGKNWLLSDYWICTRAWPPYQVTLDRLDELDWDEHLSHKLPDIDIMGFRIAFDTAKEMIEAGHLAIPDYENGFTMRIV